MKSHLQNNKDKVVKQNLNMYLYDFWERSTNQRHLKMVYLRNLVIKYQAPISILLTQSWDGKDRYLEHNMTTQNSINGL